MKLDPMMFVNAFLSPVVIKLFVFAILVAVAFGFINILIERKLKTIKPINLKSPTLLIIALSLLAFAFIILKYL